MLPRYLNALRTEVEGIPDELDYASLRRQYSNPRSLQSRKLHLALTLVPRGNRLLDVGSGEGEWIERALQKFDFVVGLETSTIALALLRDRFRGNSRVEISERAITEISDSPGQANAFDAVTMLDVLEHVADASDILRSSYHLLMPGGVIVTTTPNWYDNLLIPITRNKFHLQAHSSVGWSRIVRDAGFDVTRTRTVDLPLFSSEALCTSLHMLVICVLVQGQKPILGRKG